MDTCNSHTLVHRDQKNADSSATLKLFSITTLKIARHPMPDQKTLEEVLREEYVQLSRFDSDVAWKIGILAKQKALDKKLGKPILIDVTTADGTTYFHSPSMPNTTKDNDIWVERKRKTVFRFGYSSFYMGKKLQMKGSKSLEEAFYISSIEYAAHGGSIPIRIKNFDGVVAALTISGLKQEEDHAFALEVLKEIANSL